MLSDRNIRQINEQINREMRNVNGFLTSNEDKSAALDRIIKMNSILSGEPVDVPEEPKTDDVSELIREFIAAIRRR